MKQERYESLQERLHNLAASQAKLEEARQKHLNDVIPRLGESEERTRIRLLERDMALHDIAT